MKGFFKGMVIFSMEMAGLLGVITVDIRSGGMAGIPPTMEIYLKDVEVEEKTEGFAKGYQLTFIINNQAVARRLEKVMDL